MKNTAYAVGIKTYAANIQVYIEKMPGIQAFFFTSSYDAKVRTNRYYYFRLGRYAY